MKHIAGPKLLHVLTVKGKGYGPAEKDQTKWHAPGLFDKVTGVIQKRTYDTPQPPKYQDVFGHTRWLNSLRQIRALWVLRPPCRRDRR